MRLKEIKIALVVMLIVVLLAACGQSDAALQENTGNVVGETTTGEVAEEEGNDSVTVEETEEGTGVLTEAGAAEESETDAAAEDGATKGETEEASMAELITPVRIYGMISEVWVDQSTIVVDNQSSASSPGEIELKIDTENTLVLDATTGYPVSLEDVQTGSFEAYLSGTMTMSLPPQTTPYVVIVNIPEDYGTPQYAIVEQVEKDEAKGAVVTATDGRSYVISADTQIVPYRTKNIVTIDDIQAGSVCLIWLNGEGTASKVQIFE